jgi:hypothetical protein
MYIRMPQLFFLIFSWTVRCIFFAILLFFTLYTHHTSKHVLFFFTIIYSCYFIISLYYQICNGITYIESSVAPGTEGNTSICEDSTIISISDTYIPDNHTKS